MQVPFALLPAVLGIGIPAFAYRELPRGRAPAEVIGSLGLPLVLVGVVAAACSVPIADLLAGSRETVRTYLIIGFMTTPIQLLASLMGSCLAALERWRAVVLTTVIPFAVALTGTVVLYAAGDLTVGWAAALTIAGSLMSIVPALPLLRSVGRPVYRREVARRGIWFGLKSWVGGLALLANLRLDQVLMITVVTPRVLGLYAVATTLSGATTLAAGSLAQPVMARIAGGDRLLLPRAVRMTVIVTMLLNLVLALLTPMLLTLLFGSQFRAAVPMALVLLIGAVPFSAGVVLSSGLQADGAPTIPSGGECIALVVTVVGLIVLLGPLGGLGAALVSVAAYSTSFAFQVVMAKRRLGVPVRQFLIPTRADARWAVKLVPLVSHRLGLAL